VCVCLCVCFWIHFTLQNHKNNVLQAYDVVSVGCFCCFCSFRRYHVYFVFISLVAFICLHVMNPYLFLLIISCVSCVLQICLITERSSEKPRGYAFIEYEHERDMHCEYMIFLKTNLFSPDLSLLYVEKKFVSASKYTLACVWGVQLWTVFGGKRDRSKFKLRQDTSSNCDMTG
jgi:hypothetical protein